MKRPWFRHSIFGLSLFCVLGGRMVYADPAGKAVWFPDQGGAPRYAWHFRPCASCSEMQLRPGWALMAARAGLHDIRFLFSSDEGNGPAYSYAPNVIVLAPSALSLDTCQLAFVVGHEMVHIAQRHFDQDAQALSVMSGKVANWTDQGERAMSLLEDNIPLAFRMSDQWQQQEAEADWLGALLSAEAYGCSLEAGAIPYLEAAEGEGGGLFASHAASSQRARELKGFAEPARRLAFQAYYVER